MLGAIIGDIVGSRFEWNNHRDKDFELFTNGCFPTDDSIMSLAIAKAIIVSKPDFSDLSDNAVSVCKAQEETILIADMAEGFMVGCSLMTQDHTTVMAMVPQ